MGNPALFSGNFVKFLKANLNLSDKAYVLTGIADPTVTAQNAPAGSVYMQTVVGTANLYIKQDNGNTTNWQPFLSNVSLLALELEMQIRDTHAQSPYNFATPNIIAYTAATLVATFTGTAAYDNVSKTLSFPAIGDKVTSIQMLDSTEFLNKPLVLTDISAVDLLVYWKTGSVDQAATYEVSRDGGTNWTVMTMQNAGSATEAFYGSANFAVEPGFATLANHATGAALQVLSNNPNRFGEQFVVPGGAAWVIQQFLINVSASSAAPGTRFGNIYFQIVKDSGGVPSTALTDIVATSGATAASAFVTGLNTITFSNTVLTAGTYWIIWYGDASYYTGGNLVFITDPSGGGNAASFNGTTWTQFTGSDFRSQLNGRPLDLRVRITSSATARKLTAWSVSYGLASTGTTTATRKTQRFTFNSTTDNLSSFAITQFVPDPDLLTIYYVQGGQSFKVPSFDLQGNTAVFPTNSFNNGGVSTTITLIADQNNGGSYDNSDANANLLAQNHLGSTSGAYDRSVAGRGPLVRRLDGTLREIAIDNSDNLFILSVP